ncbi:MAG TPA: MazG-like family protein [Candidatus Enterococcus stercoripullorum]|nr:MazG-like family protein [Candidatus Enterococcus stercoripullorum]
MNELIELVEKWSIERKLNVADPNMQQLILWEEFGELNAAIARDNRDDVVDAIGDMCVVMIILCQQLNHNAAEYFNSTNVKYLKHLDIITLLHYTGYGIVGMPSIITNTANVIDTLTIIAERYDTTLEGCLIAAYKVIKDRKGKMINGVFVKESDLNIE